MNAAQNIELASIEPALPDVPTAQGLALAARSEREQAEQAVTKAKTARDTAKAEYIALPTPEGDEACERAEATVRRAERYAEAMFARLNAAETVLADAKRLAAMGELSETGDARDGLRCELAEQFHALRNLHAHASQSIAQILAICQRDLSVCERANRAARAAGIAGAARPVDVDLVRHAIGLMMTGGRPRRSNHLSSDQARPMMAMLEEMMVKHDDNEGLTFDPRLTPDERAAVLRLAVDEFARASGAPEVSDWIGPRYAPPQVLAHTQAATRHRQAQSLLLAILEAKNGEPQ